jgi:hypothetical protein
MTVITIYPEDFAGMTDDEFIGRLRDSLRVVVQASRLRDSLRVVVQASSPESDSDEAWFNRVMAL